MRIVSGARTKNPFARLQSLAIIIAVGAALTHFARFLFISFSRMAFPFSLEWMEGGSYIQVSRILAGQPLYVRPSFDFIPQIYPPVYFYFSALVSKVLENDFLPLRLVSITATLGILLLIFNLVHKQTGSKLGGLLAGGFFCATYELTGHWFDLARVDSLALAFLLLSACFLLEDKPTASILGGIFLALSCFTKQTMLITAGVFMIYCLFPLRKNNLIFIGTATLGFLGGTLALDWLHEGWYFYYIFHLPGRHNVLPNIITLITSTNEVLFTEVAKPTFIATAIGLMYLLLYPGKKGASGSDSSPNGDSLDPACSGRAVWTLVFVVGFWAFYSVWYLANLPSGAERGVLGPYSLARLLLMAVPTFTGFLAIILAIKMRKTPSWMGHLAYRLFGHVYTIPRFLMGSAFMVVSLIVILANIQPGFYDSLSAAHLQRLLPYLIGPGILMIVMAALWRFFWPSQRVETWFYLLLSFGLIANSWLGRLNPGGYSNVFMPAYAGLAILFGLGIGHISEKSPGNISRGINIFSTVLFFLAGIQFIVLLSPSTSQIPTRDDREAGQELVNRIRACSGEVYIPFHTYLAKLAGKHGYAGVVEMGELRGSFGGKADPLWDEVLDQIQKSLAANQFTAIIQDNQAFRDVMASNYIEAGQVFDNDLVFWPVTGRKIRPENIYIPVGEGGCLLTVK